MTYQEAKYIVDEIKRIGFYREKVASLQKEIDSLDQQKEDLASPKSPNGHESIGEAKGNSVSDYTIQLLKLSAIQDSVKKRQVFFYDLYKQACGYKKKLMSGEYSQYATDFFGSKNKLDMQNEYNTSNPYDRMVRIVRMEFTRL